ncbi:MAG: hypothetical protein PUH77_02910 [Bacteroidales bacterium]|nr:hypothetical protein [Bacteroidales bacterium]
MKLCSRNFEISVDFYQEDFEISAIICYHCFHHLNRLWGQTPAGRENFWMGGGGSIASINNTACCWLQFPSEINLMTEEEWDNHDTSLENADVIIDIGMCGKEKAAEKTVNCGVFEGESLLLRIFYTKNFVIQNKHITFVA